MTQPLPIPLDPQLYQEPRWCGHCGGPRTFFPLYELETGRVGVCCGCDKEVFVPFTRVTAEAA